MSQNNSFFETIRSKVSVSEIVRQKVNLTKKGQEHLGLCPFHNENTPSFTVNDQKKFYHCFGCGAHGDVIKFLSETGGFSYIDSAKKIANDFGIPIPTQSREQAIKAQKSDEIVKVLEATSKFFESQINKDVIKYLSERGISEKIIQKYEIGYSGSGHEVVKFLEGKGVSRPQMLDAGIVAKNEDGDIYPVFRKRIIYPIKNIYGKVIAFGGRIFGNGMPKYLNSPETLVFKKSDTLYGEDIATGPAYKKNRMILVEGYMDTIAMHNAGFKECVATLGTAVTKEHIQKLWKISDELIFCLDGDEAGKRATNKAMNIVLPSIDSSKRASFLVLGESLDPDDAIKKFGVKYIDQLIENRLTTSEMLWELETANKKFENAESRAALEGALNDKISLVKDEILKQHIKREFKNKIWNLTRKKPTKTRNIARKILPESLNESEIIEYNLCAILVRNPQILSEEEIYDNFLNTNFSNKILEEFQKFIIEICDSEDELSNEGLKQKMQNSSFSNLFILLSSSEKHFLDLLTLDNKNTDYKILWNIFSKKLELEQLRKEYAEAIRSSAESDFEKARGYLEEMNKAEANLNLLYESLTS